MIFDLWHFVQNHELQDYELKAALPDLTGSYEIKVSGHMKPIYCDARFILP